MLSAAIHLLAPFLVTCGLALVLNLAWGVSLTRSSRVLAAIPTVLAVVLYGVMTREGDYATRWTLTMASLYLTSTAVSCWVAVLFFWLQSGRTPGAAELERTKLVGDVGRA